MKSLILALALVGALGAQEPGVRHGRLRKGLAVGACVASAFDAGTTAWAMKVPGLGEGGVLGRGGKPLWLSLSLVKGASCGIGLYLAWHPKGFGAHLGNVPLFGSAASVALLGGFGFHNWALIRKAEAK